MRLRDSLEAVAEISPEPFEDLRRDIDPEWVLQSLQGTRTATLRIPVGQKGSRIISSAAELSPAAGRLRSTLCARRPRSHLGR
jgi:hypothetical protein